MHVWSPPTFQCGCAYTAVFSNAKPTASYVRSKQKFGKSQPTGLLLCRRQTDIQSAMTDRKRTWSFLLDVDSFQFRRRRRRRALPASSAIVPDDSIELRVLYTGCGAARRRSPMQCIRQRIRCERTFTVSTFRIPAFSFFIASVAST